MYAAEPSRSQPSSCAGSFNCWPRRRGTATKRQSQLRQRRHVAPQLLELRHREDVLLTLAPALLHVLQRDVGRHARGHGAHRVVHPRRYRRASRASARRRPAGDRYRSSRWRCCSRRGAIRARRRAAPGLPPGARGRPRAPVRRRDLPGGARSLRWSAPRRSRCAGRAAPASTSTRRGVDVVHHQVVQPRPLRQQAQQHAVAQQVRHLVPVPHRMQALHRQIVGIVGALARLRAPTRSARRAGSRAPSAPARPAAAAASLPRRSAGRAPWGSCAGR